MAMMEMKMKAMKERGLGTVQKILKLAQQAGRMREQGGRRKDCNRRGQNGQ